MAGEWLWGDPPSISTQSTLTPAQQEMMNYLLQAIGQNAFNITNTPASGEEYITETYYDGEGRRRTKRIRNPDYVAASTTVNGLQSAESYPGQIVPGMQGTNTDLTNMIMSAIKGGGLNSGLIKSIMGEYSGSFDPTDTTNLFNKTVKANALETFNEDTLPAIAEKLAGRNSFDSGATLYEFSKAGEDLNETLAGQFQTMLSSAKEGFENRKATVLPNLVSQLQSSLTSLLPTATSLGTTQQDIATSQGSENYNKWLSSQPYNNPYLQMIMQALGMETQQSVVNPGSEGLLGTIITAAGEIFS